MQIYDNSEGITLRVHCLEWYQYNEPFFESYTTQRLRIAYNIKEVIDKCPGNKCSAHFADNVLFSCFLLMSFCVAVVLLDFCLTRARSCFKMQYLTCIGSHNSGAGSHRVSVSQF